MKITEKKKFGLSLYTWHRLHYGWKEARIALPFFLAALLLIPAFNHWSLWVLVIIPTAFILFRAMQHFYNRKHYDLEVNGVTIKVRSEDVVYTPRQFQEFFELQTSRWEGREKEAENALKGVTLRLTQEKPYVPFVNEEKEEIEWGEKFGATWPDKGYSEIYAPRMFDDGVGGHEIRLHICHMLYGPQPEGKDLEMMREDGII